MLLFTCFKHVKSVLEKAEKQAAAEEHTELHASSFDVSVFKGGLL